MFRMCVVEDARYRPGTARRVVQFCVGNTFSSCNKDLTILNLGRSVYVPRCVEAAGVRPTAAGRIVQFRAVEIAGVYSSCNQHLAIWQQRRCVIVARYVEATRQSPGTAYGI